ncbi:hypothetical protein FKM82_028019 [Ascaphus truei]
MDTRKPCEDITNWFPGSTHPGPVGKLLIFAMWLSIIIAIIWGLIAGLTVCYMQHTETYTYINVTPTSCMFNCTEYSGRHKRERCQPLRFSQTTHIFISNRHTRYLVRDRFLHAHGLLEVSSPGSFSSPEW